MRKTSRELAEIMQGLIEKTKNDYTRKFLDSRSKAYLHGILDGKIDVDTYTNDFKAFLTAHNIPDKVINLIID